MSSVLRILDRRGVPLQEKAAKAAEPFTVILTAGNMAREKNSDHAEIRTDIDSMNRVQVLPPKDRAAFFSVEQRTYDSFLRALKESRKPPGAHALDLFQ